MKGKGSTDEQIAYALRQAESGYTGVCRQIGVSEASFYLWKKKKYGADPLRWTSYGLRL